MYLGLDLGTSSLKALLIDDDGKVVASSSSSISVSRPLPGYSEQDPADWIAATETALDGLKETHSKELANVKGIGLSGHMHGATLIDSGHTIIRPCILWNDTRSHIEAAELDANPAFRSLTGNIVFPGFTAPKLVWVKNNEPANFKRVAKVLLPKDYLRLWLTGETISEMSDSAGTSWLDTGKRGWSDALLGYCDMTTEQMPSLVEGSQAGGYLRRELAARWRIAGTPVVAGGAGDNAASAIGMGTVKDGDAFASLGTSGVLFAANNAYLPNPQSAVHAFCHALPATWHQMGVILSATDALNWFSGVTGEAASSLTNALGTDLKKPNGTLFLPYLSGERTPHNDAKIRGSFTGLGHESDRTAMTQAVLEGVAYAFRDNLKALEAAGTTLTRVVAVGGGSKSDYWLKVLATVLKMPVDVPMDGDFGAAFGAARLGLIAATGADPLAICTPPKIERTIEPDLDLADAFEQHYQRYRALYPAISGAYA